MKKLAILGIIILSIMVVSCGKSYDEYLSDGSDLQKSKDYTASLESFENAIKKAETGEQRVAANIQAGNLAATYLKDLDKADQFYMATLTDINDYAPADLRDLAKQALAVQANGAAVKMYMLWLDKYADDADAVAVEYELAEAYHKNVLDLRKAIEVYGNIVDKFPDSEQAPKALFSIGYIYANELGENDAATKYYSKFIETYPNHEMAPSVEFELKYLGKSLEEIPELQHLLSKTS
ncbi:MAG: tetratricopeptide repeat protein [Candidatus Marinimicrobia bacterium]|nr:tetratricopeptide repeat protein [Candidatus Neomarinimicrobiota bacterium]MCF7922484.1 tetratricopeptide repeat protein [Candidatus Neomarinimicrobiota bacterium]